MLKFSKQSGIHKLLKNDLYNHKVKTSYVITRSYFYFIPYFLQGNNKLNGKRLPHLDKKNRGAE